MGTTSESQVGGWIGHNAMRGRVVNLSLQRDNAADTLPTSLVFTYQNECSPIVRVVPNTLLAV
jgi:hypothetical protein